MSVVLRILQIQDHASLPGLHTNFYRKLRKTIILQCTYREKQTLAANKGSATAVIIAIKKSRKKKETVYQRKANFRQIMSGVFCFPRYYDPKSFCLFFVLHCLIHLHDHCFCYHYCYFSVRFLLILV